MITSILRVLPPGLSAHYRTWLLVEYRIGCQFRVFSIACYFAWTSPSVVAFHASVRLSLPSPSRDADGRSSSLCYGDKLVPLRLASPSRCRQSFLLSRTKRPR